MSTAEATESDDRQYSGLVQCLLCFTSKTLTL